LATCILRVGPARLDDVGQVGRSQLAEGAFEAVSARGSTSFDPGAPRHSVRARIDSPMSTSRNSGTSLSVQSVAIRGVSTGGAEKDLGACRCNSCWVVHGCGFVYRALGQAMDSFAGQAARSEEEMRFLETMPASAHMRGRARVPEGSWEGPWRASASTRSGCRHLRARVCEF
jgi:hypothetical protein